MRRVDLTGKRFGRLLVVGNGYTDKGQKRWLCKCNCGKELYVSTGDLNHGQKSCGCYTVELTVARSLKHGKSRTPTYKTWIGMRARCFNKNSVIYENYGGRGITVCARWENSFDAFLEDMGERPSKKYSLDRVDNNANYSCGKCDDCRSNGWVSNCRWATRSQQMSNQRPRRIIKSTPRDSNGRFMKTKI